MLKLTFNLKLDCAELGAIVKEFTLAEPQEISGIDFMKYFFRVGFEAREEEKRKQRERQEKLDKMAEDEKDKKAMEVWKNIWHRIDLYHTLCIISYTTLHTIIHQKQ
ncbi:hypothetical protein EON65_30020 [archaeon]|nr:MAG: hypothetical protein EON65_30020 [archaeon]